MSATIASAPPEITPVDEASHPEAGISASAVPSPNPVGTAPVRCDSGGGGEVRRRQPSSRSRPGRATTAGSG